MFHLFAAFVLIVAPTCRVEMELGESLEIADHVCTAAVRLNPEAMGKSRVLVPTVEGMVPAVTTTGRSTTSYSWIQHRI
jgi:hypothetical protein